MIGLIDSVPVWRENWIQINLQQSTIKPALIKTWRNEASINSQFQFNLLKRQIKWNGINWAGWNIQLVILRIVSHSLHSLSAFALFMTVGSFTHGIQYSFIPLFHFLLAASFNKFHSGFKHLFFVNSKNCE